MRSNDQNLWMALGAGREGAHFPEDDLQVRMILTGPRTGVGALVREGAPPVAVCGSLLDKLVRDGARASENPNNVQLLVRDRLGLVSFRRRRRERVVAD